MYTMKQLIKDIHAMADALNIDENRREVEFTHESGFNSIQGKYSIGYNTRGLIIDSEECYDRDCNEEVKDMSKNALRFNEFGELVYPPEKPNPPKALKTSRWKNITEKRMEKIYKHEVDKEGYEIALAMYHMKMERWLKLPTNNKSKMDSIVEDMRESGRLVVDTPSLVMWKSLPQNVGIEFHKAHLLTWEETLAHNPEKRKANPQTTLDGHIRYAPQLRVVDFDIITSFGVRPNFLLEKEWLLHILNGGRLSETARQLLAVRKEEGRKMRGF